MWNWALGLVALVAAAFALHRLALRLEAAGYLYYRDRKPNPGGVPAFLPLEEFIQPQVEHLMDAQNHLPEMSSDDRHVPDHFDPKRPIVDAPADTEPAK